MVGNLITTDLDRLETDIVAQILKINPFMRREKSAKWKHADGGRLPENVTGKTRHFAIDWDTGGVADNPITGAGDIETTAFMFVVTHYRTIQSEHLGQLVESDHWDLHDYLLHRLDPIVPGLSNILSEGTDTIDADAQIISHTYFIKYMRLWRGTGS